LNLLSQKSCGTEKLEKNNLNKVDTNEVLQQHLCTGSFQQNVCSEFSLPEKFKAMISL